MHPATLAFLNTLSSIGVSSLSFALTTLHGPGQALPWPASQFWMCSRQNTLLHALHFLGSKGIPKHIAHWTSSSIENSLLERAMMCGLRLSLTGARLTRIRKLSSFSAGYPFFSSIYISFYTIFAYLFLH